MKEYVYILTHVATGKKYVGKTSNPKSRKASHLNMLHVGHHSCKALQDDYDNLGKEIKFEVVCENIVYRRSYDTEKELMIRLQTYDEKYGYNANDWSMNPIRRANGLPYKASNRKRTSVPNRQKGGELIYEKIKKLADEKGISIYALEKEAGLKNGAISKWKVSSPVLKNLQAVATVLGVSVNELIDKEG